MLRPGCVAYVLETDTSDFEDGMTTSRDPSVVGWATWTRMGDSEVAKRWRREVNGSWYDSLNRKLADLESRYRKLFSNVDPTYHQANMDKVLHILSEEWDQELLKEVWELNGLYVDRQWQRKGLSRMLVDWGKQRAREEGVPLVVQSSPLGGAAYRKNGFQSIGEMGFSKYFDELEYGGELMQAWVWIPEDKGLDDVPQKAYERRMERLQEKQKERLEEKEQLG